MRILVNDKMQKGYQYELVEPEGLNFDPDFHPELTPIQMLEMGVFEGKYMTDCQNEFPQYWFAKARLSPDRPDVNCNYFAVKSRQPLSVWRQKGGLSGLMSEGGSNGIADIFMVAEFLMLIKSKLPDGAPSNAIKLRS